MSSVGKIHIPSILPPTSSHISGALGNGEDDDEAEDALSKEFRHLLHTVTREQVDQHTTRCPHPETAEKVLKVVIDLADRISLSHIFMVDSELFVRKMHQTLLEER